MTTSPTPNRHQFLTLIMEKINRAFFRLTLLVIETLAHVCGTETVPVDVLETEFVVGGEVGLAEEVFLRLVDEG